LCGRKVRLGRPAAYVSQLPPRMQFRNLPLVNLPLRSSAPTAASQNRKQRELFGKRLLKTGHKRLQNRVVVALRSPIANSF
jgi:hypothetical protein